MGSGKSGDLLYGADPSDMHEIAGQMEEHSELILQAATELGQAATWSVWRGPSEASCTTLAEACREATTGMGDAIGALARAVRQSAHNIANAEAQNAHGFSQ